MKTASLSATYLDHMGDDLTVVNAARTSFDKTSCFERCCWSCGHTESSSAWTNDLCPECKSDNYGSKLGDGLRLKDSDAKLIRFLARGYRTGEWDTLLEEINGICEDGDAIGLSQKLLAYKNKAQHWAPFAHPQIQIRMEMPIFLARQFVKHQVGGVWSEVSRRYVSDEPEFWFPSEWHTRPEDVKQGSGMALASQDAIDTLARRCVEDQASVYSVMLNSGVAPEEARIILPLNTMTTVVETGSLLFWARVCQQRLDSHAQLAAQELAKQIETIVQPLYPVSWAELVKGGL